MEEIRIPKDERETLGDEFDIVNLTTEVHSREMTPELNRDIILSNLDDSINDSKVLRFIKNMIKEIKLINNYLDVDDWEVIEIEEKDDEGNIIIDDETGQSIRKTRKINWGRHFSLKIKEVLMSDVNVLIVSSRARGGAPLRSLLDRGKLPEHEVEPLVPPQGGEMKKKLFGRRREK